MLTSRKHHSWSIYYFDSLDSTNSEALRLLRQKKQCPSLHRNVIIAKQQINGRGRSGNEWQSLDGNAFFSFILIENKQPSDIGLLPFIVGLALHDAFLEASGYDKLADLTLKWPNDLLYKGRKSAGILLESLITPNKNNAIIAGVGVNINTSPQLGGYMTSSLKEISPHSMLDTNHFIHLFLDSFDKIYALWRNEGNKWIISKWKSHAYGLGDRILARMPKENIEGIFENITDAGVLQIRLDNHMLREVSSGEISLDLRAKDYTPL